MFLKNMDDRMHPWVGAAHDREEWYQDLDVKVLRRRREGRVPLLGRAAPAPCRTATSRSRRAMVKVLKAGGVDFAILGPEEVCTGDPARRAGGELTFQICAKTNIETLERLRRQEDRHRPARTASTPTRTSTPTSAASTKSIHHTELINDLLRSGPAHAREAARLAHLPRPLLPRSPQRSVRRTARRPGRAVDAGTAFAELARNRSKSLCCGSGGGYAWMDDDPKKRINHTRVEEVKACGAETAAVSCPFCMQMFEDALSVAGPGEDDPGRRHRRARRRGPGGLAP